MKIEVRLKLARTTKNTFKYDAEGEDAAVRTLYVQKSAVPGDEPPPTLDLTITVAE